MAIPAALQAKLDEFEKEEKQAQEQAATDDSTSAADLDPSQELPNDEVLHDDESTDDNGGVVEEPSSDVRASDTETQNFKRMEGRYKAEIKRLQEENALLKQKDQNYQQMVEVVNALKQEVHQLKSGGQSKPTQPVSKPEDDFKVQLSAEEIDMYGDLSPVLNRVLAPVFDKVKELKASQGDITKSLAETDEASFVERVRANVPNFGVATRDNPEWQRYLNEDIPFAGMKIGDALRNAHEKRDIRTISDIFAQFANRSTPQVPDVPSEKTQQVSQPPKKGLADLATPDKNAVNQKVGKKYKYRASDYATKVAQMKAGLISKEDFMNFDRDFTQAEIAGLVSPT